MKLRVALFIAGLLLLAGAPEIASQSFQGGLRGTVKDVNGVIPGAEVSLTNEGTGFKRVVTTNDAGEYVFGAVAPGRYTIAVSMAGYKKYENANVPIGTQTFITLDVALEIGAIEESITVTGQSPVIDTSNASQGGVLDSMLLETLPAPGRAAFLIGVTIPTVIPSGDAQFNRQQDQTNASLLSLGGGARRANNYLLDGVPITDIRNRATANPTIEALEDVKVQVHTYDAEMGRTGGGVFNVTAKSGANQVRGAGFYQTRPKWGMENDYFSRLAGRPLPDTYYHLGGGGVGGPIVRNRTFFWFAAEGYGSNSTRSVSTRFPTDLELQGNFSQTRDRNGNLVVIYNPLNVVNGQRQPFAGNIVPQAIWSNVAKNMLQYFPRAQRQVSDGLTNYTETAQIHDRAQMYTTKVEHKFTDKVSLTGFYMYNKTDEPCANFFEPGLTGKNRFADPNDYVLRRRPQMLAINNTWIPDNNSVLTFRFGWTTFPDDNTLSADFDPATLGFASSFINALSVKKFPQVRIRDYDQGNGGRTLGAINPTEIDYYSSGLNGSYSRFVGTHTFKMGADYRKIGVEAFIPGSGAGGFFEFDSAFTSCTSGTPGCTVSGNSFASFLLGFPTGNPDRLSTIAKSTPYNFFTRYYAGYLQDDWRMSSKFTLNYGLRIEHEDGLREKDNNTTVAFDPTATSSLTNSVTIPADPVAGTPARQVLGGLVYAGQNGAPTQQGDLPAVKWSPRVGGVFSLNDRTVIRGGYGVYWAPWNYPAADTISYGQIGYTQTTPLVQDPTTPTSSTLDNPFPSPAIEPLGNALGPLTGVGTTVNYIDQNKGAPRVQQWSADFQRELGGNMAITLSYIGARGDNLGLGGTVDTAVNINQLDPKYLALGAALEQNVPNPFFGLTPFQGTLLGRSATLPRWRLLRPFPQFLDVNARQVTQGKNRYNAGVIELQKRLSTGWGGRFSYTYSRLKDNQFGEGNFFSRTAGQGALNNYNFIESSPYFNPDAEYAYGILDVPHRVVLSPIVELPFGRGKKWANGGVADALVGGWTISAIVNFESGFPISVWMSDASSLFGGNNRPNVVSGVDPNTGGSDFDRFTAWIDKSAFLTPAKYTFGNAPRTIPELRTRHRNNADVAFQKDIRLKGDTKAQIRIEMLNLTNTVKVRGPEQRLDTSNFGQIAAQSGFMRITQISFRLAF